MPRAVVDYQGDDNSTEMGEDEGDDRPEFRRPIIFIICLPNAIPYEKQAIALSIK